MPTHTMDTKNLAIRLSTAGVFAVIFLSLLYFGALPWAKVAFLLLMCASIFMGVREMCLIARRSGFNPSILAGTLSGLLFPLHFYLEGLTGEDLLPIWLVLVLAAAIIHFGALLFTKDPLENALPNQAIAWMAALYLGVGLGFQQKLFMFNETSRQNTGARLILALYLIVWFGDTAAYFVGSLLGKHKFAPRVSPKKTWEGFCGNLAGNMGGAFLARATACPDWSVVDAVSLGLLLGVTGSLGDLVESTWKRSAHVKDSCVDGFTIPGHGGMLDRADSLIFAAPVLFTYVHFVHGLA
ncbi:MAG TPA: phosphatidate cytidylyltransferase [Holophaga sp.]|nr:phosphatidate cytidylyltransferase [Holophaga sp.]